MSAEQKFYSAVAAHLDGLPKEDLSREWMQGNIITVAKQGNGGLRKWVEEFGGIEPFIVVVQSAYRKFIVPYDVPYVPDAIELAMDEMAIALIGLSLRYAYDQLPAA